MWIPRLVGRPIARPEIDRVVSAVSCGEEGDEGVDDAFGRCSEGAGGRRL